MEKMTYPQYLTEQQKSFDELPLFFAFSNEQLYAEMEKRGLQRTELSQIVRLSSSGAFALKSDLPAIKAWLNREETPLETLMQDPDFAESAFYYEMCNHEYGINWQGAWDVCQCFGDPKYSEEKTGPDYLRDLGYGEETINAYRRAEKRYYHDANENDWI